MYKIVEKKILGTKLVLFKIKAEMIAKSANPGQFVILRIDEKGERIPLTICDYDRDNGLITIVVQEIGYTTKKLNNMNINDSILDVVGPLGKMSDLVGLSKEELNNKKIVLIAGGLGAAPVYPQAKYLSGLNVDFDVILGAKGKDTLILYDDYKKICKNVYVCTDDKSFGFIGPVTNVLKKLYEGSLANEDYVDESGSAKKGIDIYGNIDKKTYGHAVAIGSAVMMKFTCMATKELNIPTIVSMNTIMVDGTGMCGACRLMVGDKLKFCCVDGPEFDGHLINFNEVMKRQEQYKTMEGKALLKYNEGNTHSGNCGFCNKED